MHADRRAPRGSGSHPNRRPSWRAHQAHAVGSGSPRQTPLVARTPGARRGQRLTPRQTRAPRGARRPGGGSCAAGHSAGGTPPRHRARRPSPWRAARTRTPRAGRACVCGADKPPCVLLTWKLTAGNTHARMSRKDPPNLPVLKFGQVLMKRDLRNTTACACTSPSSSIYVSAHTRVSACAAVPYCWHFGLWSVCFPRLLVRPGRRLAVLEMSRASLGIAYT